LRAREHPTVSTPVTWDEVEQALKKKDAGRLVFEAKAVLARVEKIGDLFGPVQKLKQKLPQLAGLAAGSEKEDEAAEAPPRAAKNIPKKTTKMKVKSAPAKRRKL
jgi:bifunctional non-homologous end joining protein LigD